ncbi:FMN-linked oxidoreductase [Gonapodya prolifera JEL478]|uniref:FMN-linked oxidoreductase n=1 Tax=Gonapodya prolifera (strain JEL478) TaxID=1344416 RepID=A0A139A103_GONPJ|nr:FMN-linked oxidoreductase [Gonapodya prolifera JEL478]|eukprot:KXS10404.1 FMN-linked oxidoreductase [Gonapodya prolifera JEL478]
MSQQDIETLSAPLTLPCGVILKNRLGKAPLTELLADARTNLPNERHFNVYRRWARGGYGLIVTGNVQVDRKAMEASRNVAIERQDEKDMELYIRYAKAAKENGARALAQLNHAGRQTPRAVNPRPKAPSDVKLSLKGIPPALVSTPIAMTTEEVQQVRDRFIAAAGFCQKAGFDGVQIHAAHGYLISQFLNPHVNVSRTDQYGGPLENRMQLLKEIVEGVRSLCGPGFIVSVKLNSSDFQKHGASEQDNILVLEMLEQSLCDFVEVSGGSYEAPALLGHVKKESTKKREAYFLDFASEARKTVKKMPLMITGGFRTRSVMAEAIRSGDADLIGLGRPVCLHPEIAVALLSNPYKTFTVPSPKIDWDQVRTETPMIGNGESLWYSAQIHRLADGMEPDEEMAPIYFTMVWAPRQLVYEPATFFPTNVVWALAWPVKKAHHVFRLTLAAGVVAAATATGILVSRNRA